MIKAILFDLDNTLIDFRKMKSAASNAAIDAMITAGMKLDKEEAINVLYQLYDQYGIEHQQILHEFMMRTHKNIDYGILAAGIVAYRKARVKHAKPYPGVITTLSKLKQFGLKLAIVSDAPILQVWTRLTEIEVAGLFDAVVAFDDTGQAKPNSGPFRKAIEKLGVQPEEVLHIGDWPDKDIAGAKALGMKAALAKYGFGAPMTANHVSIKPTTAKADYELNSIEEILEIVENNLKPLLCTSEYGN